jgi:hypothetical protein
MRARRSAMTPLSEKRCGFILRRIARRTDIQSRPTRDRELGQMSTEP